MEVIPNKLYKHHFGSTGNNCGWYMDSTLFYYNVFSCKSEKCNMYNYHMKYIVSWILLLRLKSSKIQLKEKYHVNFSTKNTQTWPPKLSSLYVNI